jgi:hypothetical protein
LSDADNDPVVVTHDILGARLTSDLGRTVALSVVVANVVHRSEAPP